MGALQPEVSQTKSQNSQTDGRVPRALAGFARWGDGGHYLDVIRGNACSTMPTPSLTAMIWLLFRLANLVTLALGQRISMASTVGRCPKPKWRRGSCAD